MNKRDLNNVLQFCESSIKTEDNFLKKVESGTVKYEFSSTYLKYLKQRQTSVYKLMKEIRSTLNNMELELK